MFGNASKYFFAVSAMAAVAFLLYGFVEAIALAAVNIDGAEYRFIGTFVLGGAFLALVTVAFIAPGGDAESVDRRRLHQHPASRAWWPLMSAFGIAFVIVGMVIEPLLLAVGIAVLGLAAVEWTVSAWADRLSTDAADNKAQRDRLLLPVEVPLYVVALGAIPVLLISRVFLAVSKNGASWTALAVMVVVMAVAFVFYALPNLGREVVVGTVALGAVAVVVAGIVSIAAGTRDIEVHHHDEDEEHSEESEEGAPAPDAPVEVAS